MAADGRLKTSHFNAPYIQTALKDEVEIILELNGHSAPDLIKFGQTIADVLRKVVSDFKDDAIEHGCHITVRQNANSEFVIQAHGFNDVTLEKIDKAVNDFLKTL